MRYPSPDHPLTDRQLTDFVETYKVVISETPDEVREAFNEWEEIIAKHLINAVHSRLRDTHVDTARKYAQAVLATCLEQGRLRELLPLARAANTSESLAEKPTASRQSIDGLSD